jgi:hypothetical protein
VNPGEKKREALLRPSVVAGGGRSLPRAVSSLSLGSDRGTAARFSLSLSLPSMIGCIYRNERMNEWKESGCFICCLLPPRLRPGRRQERREERVGDRMHMPHCKLKDRTYVDDHPWIAEPIRPRPGGYCTVLVACLSCGQRQRRRSIKVDKSARTVCRQGGWRRTHSCFQIDLPFGD